jgi:2-polyprenyl-6-hydroxyphenyl methylase/3-demethylubiquinone-9 3-methyltransferase
MPFMQIEAERRRESTLDPAEAARFEALAAEWWADGGKFRALHAINPARIAFIRTTVQEVLNLPDGAALQPFRGLSLVDIGCGGGILAEPLARLGADVTGIDPVPEAIAAAAAHARAGGLAIAYRSALAEDLAAEGLTFDIVVASEVIEHVADVDAFLAACRQLTKPGGALILSTLNRTARSYALAIVMAERVLGLIPRGTHDWSKFITVAEMKDALTRHGFEPGLVNGIVFNPLTQGWQLSARDFAVNYMIGAKAV